MTRDEETMIMGAVKAFYMDCAEAGRVPLAVETFDYLGGLEAADPALDWIGYCEHDYPARGGLLVAHDCITIESARRLIAEGLANDEIQFFVECFGDCYIKPLPIHCPRCAKERGVAIPKTCPHAN